MGHVYIAGPMTGLKYFNADAFFDMDDLLTMHGYNVANPAQHDIDSGFDPYEWEGTESLEETGFDLEAAMTWDLEQVRTANAVVVLPGHAKSKGTNREIDEAIAYSVPIVFYHGSESDMLNELAYWEAKRHHDGVKTSAKPKVDWNKVTEQVEKSGYLNKEQLAEATELLGELAKTAVKATVQPGEKVYAAGGFSKYMWPNNLIQALSDNPIIGNFEKTPIENRWTGETYEVRSVSATGGEKGTKLARFDLLPIDPLRQVAEHYGRGAEKYADNQWRKGYEWSKSYAALQRHANAFWGGEDVDEETGSNHMAAVAWHALALLTFFDEFPDYDDRFKS